jgi:single-strand DNA-binding protein
MKPTDIDPDVDNWVFLRGRLADEPVARELPSGDVLTVFRLTVARPEGERGRVDSLECSTVKARARRSLERAQPGDQLEITGSLRRRFWRTATGPASRYAVDADTVKLLRAGRQGGATRARTPASA